MRIRIGWKSNLKNSKPKPDLSVPKNDQNLRPPLMRMFILVIKYLKLKQILHFKNNMTFSVRLNIMVREASPIEVISLKKIGKKLLHKEQYFTIIT